MSEPIPSANSTRRAGSGATLVPTVRTTATVAARSRTEGGQCRSRVPAEFGAVAERPVRTPEAGSQAVLHDALFHGVRARLEHGEDACVPRLLPEGLDGLDME